MKLTSKLYGYLYRSFSSGAGDFRVLSFSGTSAIKWRILDTLMVVEHGAGVSTFDLSTVTIYQLQHRIDRLSALSVSYYDPQAGNLSAMCLLDGSGSAGAGETVELFAFSSLVWTFLDAASKALKAAKTNIETMPAQMSIKSAEDEWLDELGGYYGVPRNNGEVDAGYGARIIYEVLKPKNNNISIEEAVRHSLGQRFPVRVTDAPVETVYKYGRRDGSIMFSGVRRHGPIVRSYHNQFDVETDVDLIAGESISLSISKVVQVVERFRAAGTSLRQVRASGGISDQATPSSDSMSFGATYPILDRLCPHVRDGSVLRAGAVVYGFPAEELEHEVSLYWPESHIAELEYSGHGTRNGRLARSGLRDMAFSDISMNITVRGTHSSKFARNGKLRYANHSTYADMV
jgi:hypothetical protein